MAVLCLKPCHKFQISNSNLFSFMHSFTIETTQNFRLLALLLVLWSIGETFQQKRALGVGMVDLMYEYSRIYT